MKRLALAAFAVAFLASAPATARIFYARPQGPAVLRENARAVEGGRAVQVLVPPTELGVQVHTSNVSAAMGGGLLGALIDSSVDASRSRHADESVAPIRAALTSGSNWKPMSTSISATRKAPGREDRKRTPIDCCDSTFRDR